ncbi:MAG: ester cyclase [Flavobacteriaceae bacterium]|jgi:hypothetical protein|nr:ester cyclase [Flavobacteriaceae bacterium]
MKRIYQLLILSFLFLTSCTSFEQKKNEKTTKEFYETFAERKDLDKFLDFYALNAELIDAVPQTVTQGRENIKILFDWSDPNYKTHPEFPKSIEINEILANDSIVAVNGEYNPYYYNGKLIEKMSFCTWLYFNKEGKITKQVEWAQYPPDDLRQIMQFKESVQIK